MIFYLNSPSTSWSYWSSQHLCILQADKDLEQLEKSDCFQKQYKYDDKKIHILKIEGKNFTIPPHLIEKTKELVELRMNNASLTYIDGMSICKWQYLEQIIAQFNDIEKLPSKFLYHCKQLIELKLKNNKINEIAGDSFDGLERLERLDLSSNQIQYLNENLFNSLKTLKALSLRRNQIQLIHPELFRCNLDLLDLILSENDIKTIPSESLIMLKKLTELKVCFNPNLKSIELNNLNHLDYLCISNTSLTTFIISPNVTGVGAQNSKITGLVVQPNNKLRELFLSNNYIESLMSIQGTDFDKLEILALDKNPITIKDVTVVEIKRKFPSVRAFTISASSIDESREAQRMILEAEEIQIDIAITYDDINNKSHIYFKCFDDDLLFEKVYTTSSLKKVWPVFRDAITFIN